MDKVFLHNIHLNCNNCNSFSNCKGNFHTRISNFILRVQDVSRKISFSWLESLKSWLFSVFFPANIIANKINPGGSSRVKINPPFLIQGSDCTGYNIFTGQKAAGTCQDYATCLFKGGRTVGGTCALGIATCCIRKYKQQKWYVKNFIIRFYAAKKESQTIKSPTTVAPRTYDIYPFSKQYCQLKIEFVDVVLADPTNDGQCQDEKLTISSLNNFEICGLIGQSSYSPHQHGRKLIISKLSY